MQNPLVQRYRYKKLVQVLPQKKRGKTTCLEQYQFSYINWIDDMPLETNSPWPVVSPTL